MRDLGCEPEKFQGRIILMSVYKDIEWGSENNERACLANATIVGCDAKKIRLGSFGHFSDPVEKLLGECVYAR